MDMSLTEALPDRDRLTLRIYAASLPKADFALGEVLKSIASLAEGRPESANRRLKAVLHALAEHHPDESHAGISQTMTDMAGNVLGTRVQDIALSGCMRLASEMAEGVSCEGMERTLRILCTLTSKLAYAKAQRAA